jgi:uncharacterized protein (TIGR03000 family)
MYSMMLMMAAAPAGDTAAFHGRFMAKHACHGCSGYTASAGCCGGGCCGGLAVPVGCCGGGCYGGGGAWGANYRTGYGGGAWGVNFSGSGMSGYAVYGMGYGGPAVTFVPYGTTNLNPPDGSEKSTLKVELPKDAKLFVDGKEVPGSGTARAFATPALPRGADFFYDLKAEVTVDGKPMVEEKRVIVRAGETVTTSFTKLTAVAPPAGDRVAGK